MNKQILILLTLAMGQTLFVPQAPASQNGSGAEKKVSTKSISVNNAAVNHFPINHSSINSVTIYSHNTKADVYTDTQGELRGKHHGGRGAFLTELVRELMISVNQQPLIAKRQMEQALETLEDQKKLKEQEFSAVVDVNPHHYQMSNYKWVGPLLNDSIYFLENQNHPTTITSVNEAKQVNAICVRQGSTQVNILKQKGFNNIQEASSYKACWDMLFEGKVALTTLGIELMPTLLELAQKASAEIKTTGVTLRDSVAYLAFSNNTPDFIIKDWQASLDEIKSSGSYHSLIHHYYCQQDCF